MNDYVSEDVAQVEFKSRLVLRKLASNLYGFRKTFTSTVLTATEMKFPVGDQDITGFVNSANAKILRSGLLDYSVLHFHVANAEAREMIRQRPLYRLGYSFLARADPFTEDFNVDDLIQDRASNNGTIADRFGKLLPMGVEMEYIGAYMDNGHYDLEKAVKILEARSDVTFIEDSGEPITVPERRIERIPYYNADENRNQYIRICWAPSDEDFKRLMMSLPKSRRYPSAMEFQKAIFDLDILGLRAGGAALHNSFYGRD